MIRTVEQRGWPRPVRPEWLVDRADDQLQNKLIDPRRVVLLYGTTPPRPGTSDDAMQTIAEKLAARLRDVQVDGIVVYDIQDETGRTQLARPFPFTGTVDPRGYARVLASQTKCTTITYKCVGHLDERAWVGWLEETAREYGAGCLSIVGRPTSGVRYPLSLSRAIQLAAAHEAGFTVGGVVIAERHTDAKSESQRLIAKIGDGCNYFVSQTVYSADATERLLADYLRDCRAAGAQPRRIVLTFAPAGREKTIAFLRWLGVRIPPGTESAILSAANPLARSIEICRDNLRRILGHDYVRSIPLGINVESVSVHRDEIDASVDLFHALDGVLREVIGDRR